MKIIYDKQLKFQAQIDKKEIFFVDETRSRENGESCKKHIPADKSERNIT